jgi:hypothetical protein
VVSPLLANIYLHEILDVWFEDEVMPRLKGRAFLVRYADDALMVFRREEDARRVMEVLPKRFGKFGLTLHPEKTRLINFQKPRRKPDDSDDSQGPGSFDLLGFTHHWATSRNGNWVVKRKTAKGRFSRALKRIAEWCRANRHWSLPEQHQILGQKLRGHYGYYGITGNSQPLQLFYYEVRRIWKKWLSRRSQKSMVNWPEMLRLLKRYPLPTPIAVKSTLRSCAARP